MITILIAAENQDTTTSLHKAFSTLQNDGTIDHYEILSDWTIRDLTERSWKYEVIEDLGSGINFNKKGLKSLIDKIIERKFERLVLTKRDRLLRFGSELIFQLCESNNIEVVIIDQTETNSFEEELVADVLEIITVFSAKLYGKRSHKTKKLINVISKELKAKD
jgi:putative resolvase